MLPTRFNPSQTTVEQRRQRFLLRSRSKACLITPYPLCLARDQSLNRQAAEGRHKTSPWLRSLGPGANTARVREKRRYYGSVELGHNARGWFLAYDGTPCTGPFRTRLEAINWFRAGGR